MTRRISKRIASAVALGSAGSGSARRSALAGVSLLAATAASAVSTVGTGVGVIEVGESDMSVSGGGGLGLTVRRRAGCARAVAPTFAKIPEAFLRSPPTADNDSKPGALADLERDGHAGRR